MTQRKRSWLTRVLKRKRGNLPRHRRNRKLITESLEQRQLLAADIPGDDIATAQPVTLQANTVVAVDATIGDGNFNVSDVDLFEVNLIGGQTLDVDIDAYYDDSGASLTGTLNSFLRIFDSSGTQLGSNAVGTAANDFDDYSYNPLDSYLSFTAPTTGSYFIGVSGEAAFMSGGVSNTAYDPTIAGSGVASTTGDYRLQLIAGTPPGPSISVSDVTVSEDAGTATIDITLSESVGTPVTLDYTTGDGTATDPDDYTATTGSLTFAPGETLKTISIPIVDDTVQESNESFTLTVSNLVGANVADGSGTATIANDDLPPGDPPGDRLSTAQSVTLQANTVVSVDATIGDGNFNVSDVDLFEVNLIAGQTLDVDIDAYYTETRSRSTILTRSLDT